MDKYQIGLAIIIVFLTTVGTLTVFLVQKSGKRLIIAGKSLPFFIVGTMFLAQAADANATLGNAAKTYMGGLWVGFALPLGLSICLLLTGLFYAKPLNRMHLITLPDFYFRRYGKAVEVLVTILMATSFIILVAGNIAGAGYLISSVFNIPLIAGMIIMVVAVFTYTVAGGLFSCVATDIVQVYPAITAFVGSVVYLIHKYGWSHFKVNIPDNFMDTTILTSASHGALEIWAGILAVGVGGVVALDFMERVFSAKSPDTARYSCFYASGITLVIGLSCSLLGLIGLTLYPNIADAKEIMPLIATTKVPFILGLLMMGGIIGAGMSTANGGLLAICAVLARNIIQRNILKIKRVEMSEEEAHKHDEWLLKTTRWMGVPVMTIATILAYIKPEPGTMLVLAFDVVFAGCFIPLTLGLYWKKANSYGALAAIISGSVARLILHFVMPEHLAGLDTMIAPLISLAVMVPVSLMTQEQSVPKHHVVFETPSEEAVLAGEA